MPDKNDNKIEIRQGVDPAYFSNILTKDVTTLECIFELVDNAVDAARDKLLARRQAKLDSYGLPANYTGFEINLSFEDDAIMLIDNCSGIPESVLRTRAFVVGSMAPHPFGIGRFGIGLKRALIGLGSKYRLDTDTGNFAARLTFGENSLLKPGANLKGTRLQSSGSPRMRIRIAQLRERVTNELRGSGWDDNIVDHLSRRYGIFLDKGLLIRIDGVAVPRFGPKIRDIKSVPRQSADIQLIDGVHAYIDAGMHEDYRLTSEEGHKKKLNAALTDQFGWYFVCNDRIVEIATHEKSLGWKSRWHQEYYGFVGWVRFTAKDPANLPWDTKKSQIDPHTTVFRAIADRLQEFAENYKKQNKKEREKDVPTSVATPSAKIGVKTNDTTNVDANPSPPEAHNENWKMLLPAMGVSITDRKLSALVFEAERLPIERCYAGSMLLRAIVERALLKHLLVKRKMRQVIEETRDRSADDEASPVVKPRSMERVTLAKALLWLSNNEDFFPDDLRRDCVFARNKFATHLKKLNGVVHDGDLTNSDHLRTVRDDVMPLLEYLLGN